MMCMSFFYFNDTATTEIYTYLHTLSLHDALPIFVERHGIGLERGFGELLAKRTEIGELGELVVDLLVHGWYSWVGVAGGAGGTIARFMLRCNINSRCSLAYVYFMLFYQRIDCALG